MKKTENRKEIAKEYEEASKLLDQTKREYYLLNYKLQKAEKRYFEAQLNFENSQNSVKN